MKTLSNAQVVALTDLRHKLHTHPEISGEEGWTADLIAQTLAQLGADHIWTGLGGHGVAAAFTSPQAGPTVMIRCELDALPIHEISEHAYRSTLEGKGHLCGHDGHMAISVGLAMLLEQRPAKGRVILLFQPAEETGQGAVAVLQDPRWPEIRPDFAFAYHNVPGRPLGEIGLKLGPACCASRGMRVALTGKSSHAAAPEDGHSPAVAMSALMTDLAALGPGGVRDESFKLSTLTHARLGAPTFGIAPGEGELRVTLRATTDDGIAQMVAGAQQAIARAQDGLQIETSFHEPFAATVNAAQAIEISRKAAEDLGMSVYDMDMPQSWSEDFGQFALDGATAAMVFLGAGIDQPQLHNPDYDFPDALITLGAHHMAAIVREVLG